MFAIKQGHTMRRQLLRGMLAALTVMPLAATASAGEEPSIRHTVFMRGQVLEVKTDSLVVCIGRADGAEVGQELSVVRHQRVSDGPKGMGRYERQSVGKVRVTAIVDDHYAEAAIIEGDVREHDAVELMPSKG